jgi:uncharacterized protein (UPF0335 family)
MNLNNRNQSPEEMDKYIRESFSSLSKKEIIFVLSKLKELQTESKKEDISKDIISVLKDTASSNDDVYSIIESFKVRKNLRNSKNEINEIIKSA